MTMSQVVVRRFDVQVEEPRLLAYVRDSLRAPKTSLETKQVGASLLEVRLAGNVTVVSDVVSTVAGTRGVRIHHDRVRLAQTAQDTSLRPDSVYPAPRTLLSIGLKPGPPPTAPPGDLVAATPTVVAVVDSGMMVTHPDLKGRLWRGTAKGRPREYGARCIGGGDESPDVSDQDGHGTRLAGTILTAAAGAQGIQLMAVKFFDADTLPGPVNGAAAIKFATKAEPKAHIINLSWDLALGSSDLERAIQEACEGGALVVIAAGNSGSDNDLIPTIPAHYRKLCAPQIITVMASDRYNEKASFSNYGATTVDLAAPGVDIVTMRASASGASENELARYPFYRRHRSYNGTSAAAALVSGAAALLRSRTPSLSAIDLKDLLCGSVQTKPSLRSKCITGGLLDIEAAKAGKLPPQSESPAWRR
jgi:subtilisin family serine protease